MAKFAVCASITYRISDLAPSNRPGAQSPPWENRYVSLDFIGAAHFGAVRKRQSQRSDFPDGKLLDGALAMLATARLRAIWACAFAAQR